MRKIIALLFALMLLAGSCLTASAIELGEPFPDFTVQTIDGESFTLSEALVDHEAVLLNLFATWCPPCRAEFPDLDAVAARYADHVATIAVSVEPTDDAEALRGFREELGVSLPMAPMGEDDLGYYVHGTHSYSIPTTVLIDRFGNMAFTQVGAFQSESDCERVYAAALGEGYTETRTWTSLPAPKVTIDAPEDAELSAALNAGDSAIAFSTPTGEGAFPFIVKDAAVYASNTGISGTEARMEASFDAEADGALAWETLYGGTPGQCKLTVELDGEAVKTVVGGMPDWTDWAVPVSAGSHQMTVTCANVAQEGEAFDLGLKGMRLLTGDDAQAALSAMPAYPVADGSAIVPEGGRQAVITVDEMELGLAVWVVPGDSAHVRIDAAADVDPHGALVYVDGPDVGFDAVLCDINDEAAGGYCVDVPLTGAEGDHIYGVIFDQWMEQDGVKTALLVSDEAYIDEIIDYYRPQAPGMEWGWHYVEDTPAETEATYAIRVVDQDGNGVAGAYVNICTDTTCEPAQTDDDGVITYVGAPQAYHLQLLTVPEGYSFDPDMEIYTEAASGEYTIQVTRG